MVSSSDAVNQSPTEFVGDKFRLVDASAALPRRRGASYPTRPTSIKRVIIHQTEGGTKPPPGALVNEAEYFIADPKGTGSVSDGRGWPGFAYTFWVPHAPAVDADGRWIVYRCQPDDIESNHTRTANADGVAIAFQGTFASVEDKDAGPPSDAQLAIFEPLVRYLLRRYGIWASDVFPHSAFTKPMCPGFELERRIHVLQGKEPA